MARIDLTPQEIDYIGRVVQTELGRTGAVDLVSPAEYERMVGAVVDTVLNRKASGQFPGTIEEILNEDRAFSKIAGPARLNPYGTVANAPRASEQTQRVVNEHLAQRAMGKPSLIGGAVNYANRNQSDKKNREGWIDPMIAAGAIHLGNDATGFVHDHGVAPGFSPAPPVTVGTPTGFMPPVEPDQVRYGLSNIPAFAPPDRPQTYGSVNWELDRRGLAVLAPPTSSPYDRLSPETTESLQMLSEMRGPAGLNLTSAARTEEENAAARGVAGSEHTKGNAYDVSLRGMSDAEKANIVERAMMSGAKSLGTYTVTDPSHVGVLHVDFQDRGSPNVHAMVDGSARNMASAPEWFTRGLSQVTVPAPTPRPEYFPGPPSLPAAPISPVERGGPLPPAAPWAPPSFGPSPRSMEGPGGVYLDAPPPQAPNMTVPEVDTGTVQGLPSLPPAAVAAYQQYAQSRTAPQAMPPTVSLPMMAPIPAPSPRNGVRDAKIGGMLNGIPGVLVAPGIAQVGRNIRSRAKGDNIPLMAGVRQQYRNVGGTVADKFRGMFGGSLPPPTPFTVGRGLSAIQSVMAGGKPGATAYSNSHPGASWSVNAYGIPEFTSQHGFKGAVPDGF